MLDSPVAPPTPSSTPAERPSTVEEGRLSEPSFEFCRVTLWRGYRKSRFYAVLDDERDEPAVAESELFRFRGNGALERTDAIEVAHRTLIERLLSERWELDGEAAPWYAVRLRRSLSDEVDAEAPNRSS